MKKKNDIHAVVKQAYGTIASGEKSGCGCGTAESCCGAQTIAGPLGELGLSCGNPVTFSHLKPGQVVLDLGSGAGKDVFLAAREVGGTGRVIGVDMTPEMIALARRNAEKFAEATGLRNVEFREGHIEALPVEDGSVDVVISNCVINLSPDKKAVFRDVFRALKAGGKMIVSDIVLNRPLPECVKNDENLYVACVAGALMKGDYIAAIREAGFGKVAILSDVAYSVAQAGNDPIASGVAGTLAGTAASITVMAVK
jgi:SAM-dependent methyltransferase